MVQSTMKKWFYGGLLAAAVVAGSTACFAEGEGKSVLQDFEPSNGTDGGTCFQQIWNCTGDFEMTQVSMLEVYEFNPGVYYIDDVEYE